jgi:hypothetical protein
MNPTQLAPQHFATYYAGATSPQRIGLRRLPLSFVPLLLGEVIEYDWKFPAERHEIDAQFSYLSRLSPEQLQAVMAGFSRLTLSTTLEDMDWVGSPGEFSEQLSAHLWTTNQLAAFRAAAVEFLDAVRQFPPPRTAIPRVTVVVLGRGAGDRARLHFRKLRPHGAYFSQVDARNGLEMILRRAAARAQAHPIPFGHWYIDGGAAADAPARIEVLAYEGLDSVRQAVIEKLRSMTLAGAGTEARGRALRQLRPQDVGLDVRPDGLF